VCRVRSFPVVWLVCFHSSLAGQSDPGSREFRVQVRVYKGADLAPEELSRAEQEAERIFRFAGIELTWSSGPLKAEVNGNTPAGEWDAAHLQLRLWPSAPAGRAPTNSETLGFCLSLVTGDAVVLVDAVRKRAVFGTTGFTDLLGLAMVHELGHLLLRSAKHSVTGIMRARWTERGLRDDERGYFRFTPGEAESMRKEVSRRMDLNRHSWVLQMSPEITAQIYNWAAVAPQTLTAAEDEAARIFHEAGVVVSWLNCPLTTPEAQANPMCFEPCPTSRLAVRIIPEVSADRANTSLGVALSEGGIYATIFYPRVDEYAEQHIATASQILGHAMAHEIGHLLLGRVPHSRFGIMRGGWAAEDLRKMAMGDLRFSPQQSALIRQAAMLRAHGRKSDTQ
jgi:hypothetical protein